MALEIDAEWPEKLLRGWAQAYRDSPEYRFPSDPTAEFFPVDLEEAAKEIERLRGALEHTTELLADTWHTAMEGDPERQVAILDARALIGRHPHSP